MEIEAEDFEVSREAYKTLEDILKEVGKNIDTSTPPRKILSDIAKILKNFGFKYKSGRLLSKTLLTKEVDCKHYSVLYYSIAEILGLPLKIVFAPNHVFERWNDGKDIINWEATSSREKSNDYYIIWLNISAESISNGVYLKDLTREEVKSFVFLERGLEKEDLEEILANYNKAIELYPNFVIAYYNRGIIREKKDDLEGAIADYNKALELDPYYKKAYNNRGFIRCKRKNLKSALKDFTQAIVLDPEFTMAYYNRGIARYQSEDFKKAIADFNKTIELDQNHEDAYYNRGRAKLKRGYKTGAKKDFEKYRELKEVKNENPGT